MGQNPKKVKKILLRFWAFQVPIFPMVEESALLMEIGGFCGLRETTHNNRNFLTNFSGAFQLSNGPVDREVRSIAPILLLERVGRIPIVGFACLGTRAAILGGAL